MGGSGGEGIDPNALQALLDSLRKEFEDKFASKDDMEDLKARVEKLEQSVTDLDEKSQEHDSRLDNHQQEIDELKKKKVDINLFDQEINYLKQLFNSLSGGKDIAPIPTGPSLSEDEMAQL